MIRSIDYYANLISDFDRQDLISCDYDHKMHSINLYCFIKDLYNLVKSEFDITLDHLEPLEYIEQRLIKAQSDMNFRNRNKIAV